MTRDDDPCRPDSVTEAARDEIAHDPNAEQRLRDELFGGWGVSFTWIAT